MNCSNILTFYFGFYDVIFVEVHSGILPKDLE